MKKTNQYTNPWTEKEVTFLKNNYKKKPLSYIAKKLNRGLGAITVKKNRLYLFYSKERISKNLSKKMKRLYFKGKLPKFIGGKGKDNLMFGKKVSKERREMQSRALKGKKQSKEHIKNKVESRRKNNKKWFKNKKTFYLMSKAKKGKYLLDKNPNWRGGKSFEPYNLDFNNNLKEAIRKRDNYRCQQCFRHQDELFIKTKYGKLKKQKLNIHHIDFNKQNNNYNNLISLCRSCHSQTNFNRENWTNYFQNKFKQIGGFK